ncbi:MAG: hypothetical protein K2Q12_03290, partial [Rickettsiales bacterium]|nr:hypothetical protein [Rickettsiales bacterium]
CSSDLTAPYQSFEISTVNDLLNLSLFFALALVISLIGAASRWDSENARIRERRSQAFFQINRLTNNAQTMDEAIQILHRTLSEMLEMDLAFFLPAVLNRELIKHVFPHDMKMSDETQKALEQSWREKKTTGIGTPDRYHTSWRFEPMVTHHGDVGVMGFKVPRHSHVDVSFGRLTGALADHCATIIERVEMARSIEASKLHDEREQLRSMLLSSVSHDLKTPLASIIGSLSVYHSMRDRLPEERLQMLTQTAFEEAQRLDSFITNILDMSRLESGNVTFKKEWVDPIELLLRVRKRMRQRLDGRVVTIQPSIEAIEIEVDVMMTEQVMQNILDNAIKYSPKGSEISISMFTTEQGFCIEVRDRGKGIPEEKHEMVFDKYSRLKMEDSLVAGTGLGLAISKKIIDAQEGSISITNHSEGGAIFALNFSRVRHVYPAAMANVL